MVRFVALCVVLLASSISSVESAFRISQVCKSDSATWENCTPLEQAEIKQVLKTCRADVLADARISTGRRAQRRLGEQQQQQQQERRLASCPEPLTCEGHDKTKMCFADKAELGCDTHFGGLEMVHRAQGLADSLKKCTKDAIQPLKDKMVGGNGCRAALDEILGGCEQVAYIYQ
jgi:hypothetical protein